MPEVQNLFNGGEIALVGGIGPLIEPTTRSAMDNNSVAVPRRLFSHNDQQSTWMSNGVEGAREGWGGKFAAAALRSAVNDRRQFAAITTSYLDVFLASDDLRQFRMSLEGAPALAARNDGWRLGSGEGADRARDKLRNFLMGQGAAV